MDSIFNCKRTEIPAPLELQCLLADLMPRPAYPVIERLRERGLVYIPFFSVGLLDISDRIFSLWEQRFIQGVVALEDRFGEQGSEENRFGDVSLVHFRTAEDFHAGGFFGRIFIILNEDEFLYFDHLESSGICCKLEHAERLLGGGGLRAHFTDLLGEVEDVEDEVERVYYRELIENAAKSIPPE